MKTSTPISPKVYAGGATSVVLFVIAAILGGVTTDMLHFAGQFTPLVYIAVTSVVALIAQYLKDDPLRIPIEQQPQTMEDVFGTPEEGAPDEPFDNPDEYDDDGDGDFVRDPEDE